MSLRQVLTGNENLPADIFGIILKVSRYQSRKEPTCCFWTAQSGVEKHGKTIDELQRAGVEVGVIWQDGRPFHGPCHIRMNLALPFSRVQEAFKRLDRYVFQCKIAIIARERIKVRK